MIEEALDKLVAAIEGQTAALERAFRVLYDDRLGEKSGGACAESPQVEAKRAMDKASQPANDASAMTRDEIKRALDEAGIKYNSSSKTETLAKILQAKAVLGFGPGVMTDHDGPDNPHWKGDAEPEAEKTQEAPAPDTKPAPEQAGAATPTTDDVVKALNELNQAKGREVTVKIIRTVGQGERLSLVDPSRYAAVIAACKEAANA